MSDARFPKTLQAMWRRWLGFRFPHYDHIESASARTLTGTRAAVVRVGWNRIERVEDESHVTLFTLTGEHLIQRPRARRPRI